MSEYWVRTGAAKPHGPFSSRQLKQLASSGKLLPTHDVSVDRRDWKKAARVNGLQFATPHESTESENDAFEQEDELRLSPLGDAVQTTESQPTTQPTTQPTPKLQPSPRATEVDGSLRCPDCDAVIGDDHVICVACGFDLKTGTKLQTIADDIRLMSDKSLATRIVITLMLIAFLVLLAEIGRFALAKSEVLVISDTVALILGVPALLAFATFGLGTWSEQRFQKLPSGKLQMLYTKSFFGRRSQKIEVFEDVSCIETWRVRMGVNSAGDHYYIALVFQDGTSHTIVHTESLGTFNERLPRIQRLTELAVEDVGFK